MNVQRPDKRFESIDELYAFIMEEDGGEGILGFRDRNGMMWPMIGADLARVESLKPLADRIAKAKGKPYEIRYFKRVK
jgi:hypothetical protein